MSNKNKSATVPKTFQFSELNKAFGFPDFFGSSNSGNENCYPILVSKKHYSQFRVSDNLGLGILDLPEFLENNTLHKISIAIYI